MVPVESKSTELTAALLPTNVPRDSNLAEMHTKNKYYLLVLGPRICSVRLRRSLYLSQHPRDWLYDQHRRLQQYYPPSSTVQHSPRHHERPINLKRASHFIPRKCPSTKKLASRDLLTNFKWTCFGTASLKNPAAFDVLPRISLNPRRRSLICISGTELMSCIALLISCVIMSSCFLKRYFRVLSIRCSNFQFKWRPIRG